MLVADSGSTKTEWRCCQDSHIIAEVRTQGFNPSTTPFDELESELEQVAKNNGWQEEEEVFFYSTGTGHPARRQDLRQALQKAFPRARVEVQNDLIGAALSTGRQEGIICILGTGSNSAHFADGQVQERRGGLGYLFGDEGSGADLGKHLLKGVLEQRLPEEARELLRHKEKMEPEELMRAIYQDERPQVRMAALCKYLPELWHLEPVQGMILDRFDAFLTSTILPYSQAQRLPIDAIGAIGHFFKDFFVQACEIYHLEFGQAILHPIENLTRYHLAETKK
jgi:glucosamine kinase